MPVPYATLAEGVIWLDDDTILRAGTELMRPEHASRFRRILDEVCEAISYSLIGNVVISVIAGTVVGVAAVLLRAGSDGDGGDDGGPGGGSAASAVPAFTGIDRNQNNIGKLIYDSAQFVANRRFSKGVTINASYTWVPRWTEIGGYVADAPNLGWRWAFEACGIVGIFVAWQMYIRNTATPAAPGQAGQEPTHGRARSHRAQRYPRAQAEDPRAVREVLRPFQSGVVVLEQPI